MSMAANVAIRRDRIVSRKLVGTRQPPATWTAQRYLQSCRVCWLLSYALRAEKMQPVCIAMPAEASWNTDSTANKYAALMGSMSRRMCRHLSKPRTADHHVFCPSTFSLSFCLGHVSYFSRIQRRTPSTGLKTTAASWTVRC
jgi:hypothetical protein